MEDYFTTEDIAKDLKVTRITVRKLLRKRGAKVLRLPGGGMRISESEYRKMLAKNTEPAISPKDFLTEDELA